jgi:anti-sigma-K factor RskA
MTQLPTIDLAAHFRLGRHIVGASLTGLSAESQPNETRGMGVTSTYLWRVALIGILCVALSTAAAADQLKKTADTALALAIVAVAAVVIVVVVVIHDSNQKRTITGCINTAQNGMTVTDEKDKRVYTLSGDTTGVKPGERMTLHLKKIKAKGSDALTWETKKVTKDFGVCLP